MLQQLFMYTKEIYDTVSLSLVNVLLGELFTSGKNVCMAALDFKQVSFFSWKR